MTTEISKETILGERIEIGRIIGRIDTVLGECRKMREGLDYDDLDGDRAAVKTILKADRRRFLSYKGMRLGPTVDLSVVLESRCELAPSELQPCDTDTDREFFESLCELDDDLEDLLDAVNEAYDHILSYAEVEYLEERAKEECE